MMQVQSLNGDHYLGSIQNLNPELFEPGTVSDTTPDQFTFTDQTGVALSSTITSAPVTITGIDAAADITVSGGTYSINGGAFTASAGTVVNGDQVRARNTSSASYDTATDTVITIGGISDTFTSQTMSDPADNAQIGFGAGILKKIVRRRSKKARRRKFKR